MPMKVDDGLWNKLTRLVVGLLLLAGLLGIAVWYLPLIRQNERMGREVQRLDNEIRKEVETQKQLDSSISALRGDSNAVARLVREKLGYAKPGETVIRFEDAATNANAIP
jgi:cell division protein FtsB